MSDERTCLFDYWASAVVDTGENHPMKKFLLVDGDVVRYRCGFAAQHTRYRYGKEEQTFDSAKEANYWINERDLDPSLRWSFLEVEPVENALHSVKLMMQSMQEKYPDAELEVYFSCPTPDNWRTRLYPQYKANRPDRKPEHDAAIRDYMANKYPVQCAEDLEADDFISIRAAECRAAGQLPIIATIDKDMDQIPGLHYDFVKDEEYEIDDDYADYVLEIQTISGDSTDNIPGLPGMGTKRAISALEQGDAWDAYKSFYDDENMAWYHYHLNQALVTMPTCRADIDSMIRSVSEWRKLSGQQQ